LKRIKFYIAFFSFCIIIILFSIRAFAFSKTSNSLIWPVDYNSDKYWIAVLDYYSDGTPHGGIDIYGAADDSRGTVYAIADGEIVSVYNGCSHVSRGKKDSCGGGYGNHVKIKHADGSYSLYAHLEKDSIITAKSVKAGEAIAKIGSSGRSTGYHLHFEIYTPDNQKDYAFDYYMNNTEYQKKFVFSSHLRTSSKKYGSWIDQNYKNTFKTKSGNVYYSYSGTNIPHSKHTYDDKGYCTVGGEEYPISLQKMPETTYQVINDNTPVRWRPYESEPIFRKLSKGTGVTVVESGKNAKGNLWYKLNDGTWVYSENVKKSSKPSKPTGFTITKASSSTARLSWNPVEGATSYVVEYMSPTSGGWKVDRDYRDNTSTSYITTNLAANKTYQFKVYAVNSFGESDFAIATYNSKGSNSGTVTKPNTPTGLTVTKTSDTTARVSWNAVSNATSYVVEYNSPNSKGWTTDREYVNKTATSYNVTRLGKNVTYQFRVCAINSAGSSDWAYVTYTNTVEQPGTATIKYNANGGSGTPPSHNVEKDSNGIIIFNLSTTKPTRSGYTFLGWRLENSTAYDIDSPGQRIAFDTGDPNSNTVLTYYAQWKKDDSKLDMPRNFKITKASASTATVSWDPVEGATSYEVEYWSRSWNEWRADYEYSPYLGTTTTTYITKGLSNHPYYEFRVRAKNASGVSEWAYFTYYK